jgi:hypothetical protein
MNTGKGAAWRSPVTLLVPMSMESPIALNAWNARLDNFAIAWAT